MKIELSNRDMALINPQSIERTAERLTYNSADILKILVHRDVYEHPEDIDLFRAGALKRVKPTVGYNAEIKLALAHIIVSSFVLADQLNLSEIELAQLVKDTIEDHNKEW